MQVNNIIYGMKSLNLVDDENTKPVDKHVLSLIKDLEEAVKLEIHITNDFKFDEPKFYKLPTTLCYYEIVAESIQGENTAHVSLLQVDDNLMSMNIFIADGQGGFGITKETVILQDEPEEQSYSIKIVDMDFDWDNTNIDNYPPLNTDEKYLELVAKLSDIVFRINKVLDTQEVEVSHMEGRLEVNAKLITHGLDSLYDYDLIKLEI